MTTERAALLLADVLRELDRPSGPTECQDVMVRNAWAEGNEIAIVYTAPWFDGMLGFRQRIGGRDDEDLAEDIAHFEIAEPLGRLSLVLDPPDADGITWWDETTSLRLRDHLASIGGRDTWWRSLARWTSRRRLG